MTETEEDKANALQDYEESIVQNPDFTFYCVLSNYYGDKQKALIIKNMKNGKRKMKMVKDTR